MELNAQCTHPSLRSWAGVNQADHSVGVTYIYQLPHAHNRLFDFDLPFDMIRNPRISNAFASVANNKFSSILDYEIADPFRWFDKLATAYSPQPELS